MTEPSSTAAPAPSVFSRLVGVIFSPKATFERIVPAPKVLGIILISGLLIGLSQGLPLFTESGKQAAIEAQAQQMKQFTGRDLTDEQMAQLSQGPGMKIRAYATMAFSPIPVALFCLFFAGLYYVAFNAILGGTATFKQVFAISAHSSVIAALGAVAKAAVEYAQGTMTTMGPFTIGALMPMLDEGSFVARFLGFISVFSIWGTIVTAIGLSVLYRRKTVNIAIGLFLLTLLFAAIGATVMGFFAR